MFSNPALLKLVLYGAGLFITIGALYGLSKYLKASALRSHEGPSMTLDDLERMKETGLIEEEELRRIRRKVSERMLEASMPKPAIAAEDSLKQALAELSESPPESQPAPAPTQAVAPPAAIPSRPQRQEEEIVGAARPTPPSMSQVQSASRRSETKIISSPPRQIPSLDVEPPPAPKGPSGLPLDIEKLRATGAIDDAEYERLKSYFSRRKQ